MGARDPRQPHRAASPLELFFDLVSASAAAVSAGIEVQVAAIARPEDVGALAARTSVLVPVALFIAAVAVIVLRPHLGRDGAVACAAAVVLLLVAARSERPRTATAG